MKAALTPRRGRWLVLLVLGAACGSSGHPAATHDGASDTPSIDGAPSRGDTSSEARDGARPDAADAVADGGLDARDGNAPDADATDATDATDAPVLAETGAPPAYCPVVIPTVTVGSGPVSGTLQGPSYNPAVSCHGGVPTSGPEAFFTLTITQTMTVEAVVTAPVDTLVAIRAGACTDGVSEVACGDLPPTPDADAGALPAPTGDAGAARVSAVRAPLLPGMYTIVVDSYTLGSLTSASFTLTLRQLSARPNATCAAPTVLTSGMTVSSEPLDLAGPPPAACGTGLRPSLYYSVGIPSGQRLVARAKPVGGDRTWMPRIEAFPTCASTTCLGQGRLAAGGVQELDWTNSGANWQLVYLAVSADAAVTGATFDLTASVVDLSASCTRPTPVMDGTVLTNQDLSIAPPADGPTCNGSATGDHALYYTATLLPQQSIEVDLRPSAESNAFGTTALVSFRDGCGELTNCTGNGQTATFQNDGPTDSVVLIEVVALQKAQVQMPFDVVVSMPPPPAGVVVTPEAGLVTTESGGTATFTVVLTSPPTADVTIAVASDTPTEGTASPATLRFTSDNWRTPQTVTVTGVDDQVSDGARDYTIVTSAAQSTDTRYAGLDPDDVGVTNLDNDPGVAFGGAADLVTSESGLSATFTAQLNAAPTSAVTMTLASSDPGEGTVSPAQLTFTTTNWNMPQTVTVTGVDDTAVDGTQAYTIVTGTLASADTRYNGQNPPDLPALNRDDDQAAVAPKLLSAEHSCSASQRSMPIAVDDAGQIYIVMQCDVGFWVVTSTDAGVTFTAPTAITGTDDGQVPLLAAGAPGFAYLQFQKSDGNLAFTRTTDGGATWSAPAIVSTRPDLMGIGAAGKSVFLLVPGPTNAVQAALLRSFDGGRTFLPRVLVDGQNQQLAVEPDGRTVWLAALDNPNPLRKSTDAGATFTKIADLNQDLSTLAIGKGSLYTMPGQLSITSLADPTMTQVLSTNDLNIPPFSTIVDESDALLILDGDPSNRLRATRFPAGGSTFPAGRVVGPSPQAAGLAPLSRKAAAVVFLNGSIVLYSTIVW
jgi:hypothetical protein